MDERKARIISLLWTLGIFGFGIAWLLTQAPILGVVALIFALPLAVAFLYFLLTAPTTNNDYYRWKQRERK